MIIEELNNKKYTIPKNIPYTTEHKYVEVINKGYAKYLAAIGMCGTFCMLSQFAKMFDTFNKGVYTESTVRHNSSIIIKKLEELGFIGTDYLSKYKYLYLRQPGFSFYENDYLNYRRVNIKNEMKADKFLSSIIKIEYLLDYDDFFSHKVFNEQLIEITNRVLQLIISSKNKYKFDTTTIKRIIELKEYDKIKDIVNNTREANTKLGIVRFIWGEIGREFKKLGMQGQTILNKPLYFKLNLQEDGSITLHYAPIIVIFDTSKDLEYYKNQSNKFFHTMFNLKGNVTHNIKECFKNRNDFGYSHFNRVGYTVKVIGSDIPQLTKKVDVLNNPYYGNNEYSPLVVPADYTYIDVNKYIKYSSSINYNNELFNAANDKLEKLVVDKINIK